MPTPDAELSRLLEELRNQGEHAGKGGFTLRAERARELLARHRLGHPSAFVLAAVAAASQGRSTQLDIEMSSWSCRMEWRGMKIDGLDQVPDMLLAPTAEGHLAMVLWQLASMNPARLSLQAGDQRLVLAPPPRRLLPAEPCDGLRLEVQLRASWWQRLLRGTGPLEGGLRSLGIRCRHAGFPISLNEVELTSPILMQDCAELVYLERPGRELDARVMKPRPVWLDRRPSPGDFEAAVGLHFAAGSGSTEVIVDGLSYEGPRIPNARIFVWADNLKVDLSLARLVEDERLDGLIRPLRETVRELGFDTWRRAKGFPPERSLALLTFLERDVEDHSRLETLIELYEHFHHPVPARLVERLTQFAEHEGPEVAERCLRRAMELDPSSETTLCFRLVAVMKRRGAPPAEIEPYFKLMISGMHKRAAGISPIEAVESYYVEMGRYARDQHYRQEAADYYMKALQIRRGRRGPSDPSLQALIEELARLSPEQAEPFRE